MTDEQPAVTTADVVITDTQDEERLDTGHGRPVDDGPGQHHANANTRHTPTQQSRVTHDY